MNALQHLADFLLPRHCHICGATLAPAETRVNHYVCPACIANLPRTLYHRHPDNPMVARFAGIFPFERASGHFFYSHNAEISLLVTDFKYRRFPSLARFLGHLMAKELIVTPFLSDIDAIMPIPMHWLKKARRGYNQTEMLAAGVSEVSGIPVLDNLRAVRPHKTQTRLSQADRLKNLREVFCVNNPSALTGKHILLLDDICTTGATLTSAAERLLAANPAIRLSLLTLGVTF